MMGGQIDYTALPIMCEMVGVVDVEGLINQLITIRDNVK